MWGTPWVSRWTVTGAERPEMETEPSSCGRDSRSARWAQCRALKKAMMVPMIRRGSKTASILKRMWGRGGE